MRKVMNSWGLTRQPTACASVKDGLLCTSILALKPPNPGNHEVDTLAVSTAGTSVMVLRTSSWAFRRACQVGCAPFGKPIFMASTWSGSKPSGVWMRATKAFIAAPAAAIRRSVNATCPAIRRRCVLRPRTLPRRRDSKENSREQCHRGAEHQHQGVYMDGRFVGKGIERQEGGERIHTLICGDNPQPRAGHREHHRFRQQLADQAAAPGAHRNAHREFMLPRRSAGQH